MASVLEQIQVKYKGREVDKSSQQTRTTLIYQGSKELCEEWMNDGFMFSLGDFS